MAETIIEHHFETVSGVNWHWAEAGEGDPVVLLHGIPESWQCWIHQIPTLATQFRVLAFDLKGYGLSDKADGDYTASNVARELLQCLDFIGVDRFRIAGHDWGVMIADNIVNLAPNRVERYARCCLSLHRYDARNSLHHQWNSENPEAATRLMRKAGAYVRVWMESSCKPELLPPKEELESIVTEFAHEGVAEAVPRYFRDIKKNTPVDYSKFTMPVLYVHGEHDPRQPVEYCHGMEEHLPGLEAVLLLDSGHFVTRERPVEMTNALMWFFCGSSTRCSAPRCHCLSAVSITDYRHGRYCPRALGGLIPFPCRTTERVQILRFRLVLKRHHAEPSPLACYSE